MSSVADAAPGAQIAIDPRAAKFFGTILLASFGPWLLVPLLAVNFESASVQDAVWALMVFGVAHVGMTGFFWIDRRYRAHIATRQRWFYAAPGLVAIVSLAAVIGLDERGFIAVTAVNTAWLYYHFTKQNWGLLSLVAVASRAGRPATAERWLYVIGGFGATFGLVQFHHPVLETALHQLGQATASAVSVIAIGLALYRLMARAHWAYVLMTAFAGVFPLTIFLFGPLVGAFIAGTSHSLQYMTVMALMAGDHVQGNRFTRISGLLLCGATVAAIYAVFNYPPLWGGWANVLNVAYLCISMWHFIVDADVWRLREPFQRQALRESMPYLFAPR